MRHHTVYNKSLNAQLRCVKKTDRILAVAAALAFAPWLFAHTLFRLIKGKKIVDRVTLHSAAGDGVPALLLHDQVNLSRLPLLLNVIKGELALVGYRARTEQEPAAAGTETLNPGMFSLFELRRISGIDFIDEEACNLEYADKQGFKTDAAIIGKSLLAGLLYSGGKTLKDVDSFTIFGVNIANISMENALSVINKHVTHRHRATVFFANAHTLNLAYNNSELRSQLNQADYMLPDGSGIEMACRRNGIRRKGNVNGTDMLPLLCEQLAQHGQRLFMLGGEDGIADAAMQAMLKQQPHLRSAGTQHGYFDKQHCQDIVDKINDSGADVLLVGMGQPLQEQWILAHREQLNSPVVIAVGGLFDFYAEKVSRAPLWLRELGMEWIWRLLQEPGRMWKRYIIGNPLFLLRLRQASQS